MFLHTIIIKIYSLFKDGKNYIGMFLKTCLNFLRIFFKFSDYCVILTNALIFLDRFETDYRIRSGLNFNVTKYFILSICMINYSSRTFIHFSLWNNTRIFRAFIKYFKFFINFLEWNSFGGNFFPTFQHQWMQSVIGRCC